MRIKVYGYSDDLIEFESDSGSIPYFKGKAQEIDTWEQALRITFTDGTKVVVQYGKEGLGGIWDIIIEKIGTTPSIQIDRCFNNEKSEYSDILIIEVDDIKSIRPCKRKEIFYAMEGTTNEG